MIKELLQIAINASIEAGFAIDRIYNDPESDFEIERKSDNSPLTIADRKSNEVIMEYLSKTEFPVLSEEGRAISFEERAAWDTLWIVDPLDGTKEFIKKNGEFTVNVALVKNGTPILGVIYLPVKRTLYFAAEGIGSFKTEVDPANPDCSLEKRIQDAVKLPVDSNGRRYRVVASRSHCSAETLEFISEIEKTHGEVETVSSGSSIKICMVAEGFADVYPRFAPTMEWDTAAGHAIAIYAGKQIFKHDQDSAIEYNKENLLNPWFIVR